MILKGKYTRQSRRHALRRTASLGNEMRVSERPRHQSEPVLLSVYGHTCQCQNHLAQCDSELAFCLDRISL